MKYTCAGSISIHRQHPLRTRPAFWPLGMQEPLSLPAPTPRTPSTWETPTHTDAWHVSSVPEGGPRRSWGARWDTKQVQRATLRSPLTQHLDLHRPAGPHDAPSTRPCRVRGSEERNQGKLRSWCRVTHLGTATSAGVP